MALAGLLKGVMKGAGAAKSGGVGKKLASFIQKSQQHPFKHGIPQAGIAGVTGKFAYDVAIEPPAEALHGMATAGDRLDDARQAHFARQQVIRATQERSRAVRESIRRNIAIIAQTNPQLYNELVVGRRLPRGAVVLGGTPRKDLLEEVATMMAGAK
jgi:hypothetical protein